MKKVFCLLSLALLCPAAANAAEDAGDFYQNQIGRASCRERV